MPDSRSVEQEVKLSVPEGFTMPPLEGIAGTTAQGREAQTYTTTYYDTPDLRLAAWGSSLRHRTGEGWTVKLAPSYEGDVIGRAEHRFNDAARPPAAALDLLRAYLRGMPVTAAARLRAVRRRTDLASATGVPLVAVVDDAVSTGAGGRAQRRLRQIEVELLAPAGRRTLDGAVAALVAAGAIVAPDAAKYQWALGERAPAETELPVRPSTRRSSGSEVVRAALAASVTRLLRVDAAVRGSDDPEAVHEARVATRRLRADLRSFGGVLDRGWSAPLRTAVRWLADALGVVRDAEVLLGRLRSDGARLESPEGARAITALLEDRVARGRADLAVAFASDRYLALLERLVAAARAPVFRAGAGGPATEVLVPSVRRAWRGLRDAVDEVTVPPDDDGLHLIRIEAKRVRYAAEAVAPALGKSATALAKAAAGLQGVLGEHQDAVVSVAWLRSIAGKNVDQGVVARLIKIETGRRDRARRRWERAWDAIRARRPGTWR